MNKHIVLIMHLISVSSIENKTEIHVHCAKN